MRKNGGNLQNRRRERRNECRSDVSQSGVVVRRRGHLQDALSVLLHQGAPLHLPAEQQVLTVQRVDVLHLHRQVHVKMRGNYCRPLLRRNVRAKSGEKKLSEVNIQRSDFVPHNSD